MGVKVTALKDLKLQARIREDESDRVFDLLKGDQLYVLAITDVCECSAALNKRKIPLPRKRGEMLLFEDLLRLQLNRAD